MPPPENTEHGPSERGTKRKRPSGTGTGTGYKPKQEPQGEIVAKKLHHGLQEVRKAAKKAGAFELQKLVRRLKQARTKDASGKDEGKGKGKGDDPGEMERQLEVLKAADHEQFAHTALRTKILKDKLLAADEGVQAAVAAKLSAAGGGLAPQAPGSAAAKVHGRLLSSKVLADAVNAVVEQLKEVLDPSLRKGKGAEKGRLGGEDDEGESEDESGEEEGKGVRGPGRTGKKARLVDAGDDDEEDGESGSEGEGVDDGWESGTVDGADGSDGAGWESGSVDGDDLQVAGSSGEGPDDGSSGSDTDTDPAPPQKTKIKAKPAATDPKGKQPASAKGESTFLPSLSVGFTRGDSDASDLSEDETGAADAPRKNRRGQRARRAIWEKKYGRNANHVKTQREIAGARAGGWGPPRDQRERNQFAKPGHGAPAPRPSSAQAQKSFGGGGHGHARGGEGAHARPGGGMAGKAGSREDTMLHPSWEAKKKMKEKMNPGIVPAQGKKITF